MMSVNPGWFMIAAFGLIMISGFFKGSPRVVMLFAGFVAGILGGFVTVYPSLQAGEKQEG